jgi:DNA-binding Lrp family transcriptional regulator
VAWVLRVQVTPDAAVPVAGALARRKDTSWVRLTSGGTQIVCVTRARSSRESDALLLGQLPRTPSGWHGRADSLTPEQVAALAPEPPPEPQERVVLLLGYETLAILWLTVDPALMRQCAEAIAAHPEVGFAAATTGPSNLLVIAACRDVDSLYDFLERGIGDLPGIRQL